MLVSQESIDCFVFGLIGSDAPYRLYENLTSNQGWLKAIQDADAILFATHSQGSIVSTHLLHRLLADGHIHTGTQNLTELAASATSAVASGGAGAVLSPPRHQLVCCLALCGIHLGPLAYLHKSSLVQPYLQVSCLSILNSSFHSVLC